MKKLTYEQAKHAVYVYEFAVLHDPNEDTTLLWERCLAEAMNWHPDDTENSDE